MASNKNIKLSQLSKDFNIKAKDLIDFLQSLGIDKKTGASLDEEEFEIFFQKITEQNQIENLSDYLSGKATIVSEAKEAEIILFI